MFTIVFALLPDTLDMCDVWSSSRPIKGQQQHNKGNKPPDTFKQKLTPRFYAKAKPISPLNRLTVSNSVTDAGKKATENCFEMVY